MTWQQMLANGSKSDRPSMEDIGGLTLPHEKQRIGMIILTVVVDQEVYVRVRR